MTLRLKTILGIALIEAVLLALLISFTFSFLKDTNYESLSKRGETTARLFASSVKDAVLSWDLASVGAFTQELSANPDIIYVRVLDQNGNDLAFAGDDTFENVETIPEQKAELVQDGTYDVSFAIKESDIKYGEVQLGFDMTYLNEQIEKAQHWSFFIVLGEMALVALFSYVLGAFLTKRITYLERAAEKLASGERNIRVDDKGNDEISHLASAFNIMVEKLTSSEKSSMKYQEQLETFNATLEEKIKRRTSELEKNNAELVRTNKELKETQGKLIQSEKLASIGTMAAGFAHEINNPIGSVDSNLQTAFEYLDCYKKLIHQQGTIINEGSAERRDELVVKLNQWSESQDIDFIEEDFEYTLKDALTNTHRVRDIVHGLKNYSTYNKDTPKQDTDLNELVSQCTEQIKFEYKSDTYIEKKLSSDISLFCNQTEIKQAINAVLKNALQAVESSNKKHVDITTEIQGKNAIVSVVDTGEGISESAVKQIFDPFYTTRPVGSGTGLGLTIAYNVIEQHGGKIDVSSLVNEGTKVSIVLPLSMGDLVHKKTNNSDETSSQTSSTERC
ncbi:HAMP domain-containing protein [Vibrio sp. SCSIO 43132]|uniref:HAMP domain-containing sensor histidine kinase n=1 Tax=Vibrio sp. SCSIO 43132 TaxID=2779363 RepID=UPI001CA87109|nr:ATP-binding protein [Vibrio sp. SCSIO 43132]UAB72186.1 HAMP domain-containing protein [Vibrio sp. SCSIO 43132]